MIKRYRNNSSVVLSNVQEILYQHIERFRDGTCQLCRQVVHSKRTSSSPTNGFRKYTATSEQNKSLNESFLSLKLGCHHKQNFPNQGYNLIVGNSMLIYLQPMHFWKIMCNSLVLQVAVCNVRLKHLIH